MSYSNFYTEQRVRSFRARKMGEPYSRVQGVLAAIVFTVALLVLGQYVVAQRDLTSAQVEYYTVSEAE